MPTGLGNGFPCLVILKGGKNERSTGNQQIT